jgi:hypothetical protein
VDSILIFGDTVRCPELRVGVPHSVADPFLYVERNGDRHAVMRSLEPARMSEVEVEAMDARNQPRLTTR